MDIHLSTSFRVRSSPPLVGELVHSPRRYCSFSPRGEEMIHKMIAKTPQFHSLLNKLIPVHVQKDILESSFKQLRAEWEEEMAALRDSSPIYEELEELERSESKKKGRVHKKFFSKNFTWSHFVPQYYRRTSAPRITTDGGTLHAMKKTMMKLVLTKASLHMENKVFIDVDMSACHANVAAAIQNKENSILRKAVRESGKFWDEYAQYYTNKMDSKGLGFSLKQVRRMLKVSFYTSLNGGNPFGKELLCKNLSDNAPEVLSGYPSIISFGKGREFRVLNDILKGMEIIQEVKSLNKSCVKNGFTYTIDRAAPYAADKTHKGISRALQGVEVVLLAVLAEFVCESSGIPMNLAHDGLMAVYKNDRTPQQVCQRYLHKTCQLCQVCQACQAFHTGFVNKGIENNLR